MRTKALPLDETNSRAYRELISWSFPAWYSVPDDLTDWRGMAEAYMMPEQGAAMNGRDDV